jgi:hypothetical protein
VIEFDGWLLRNKPEIDGDSVALYGANALSIRRNRESLFVVAFHYMEQVCPAELYSSSVAIYDEVIDRGPALSVKTQMDSIWFMTKNKAQKSAELNNPGSHMFVS